MFAKRDVFALLLSCFAVYYSTLSEGVVSFHPAFVVARDVGPGETAWDKPGFLSGRFDGRSDVDDPTDNRNANKRDDHPPPPQFFDLNGDGVREMLVATGGSGSGDEPQLRMVEMSREDIGGNKGRDRQRRRANANSYSRATEDVLAGERGVRGGAQTFFGSVDAFERARVLARASLAQPPPRGEGGDSDTDEEREETDEHERERSGRSFGSRAPIALGVGAVRPASFKNASSSVASKKNIRRSMPSNSRNGSRKGVVVVVTEGWHVVCFDHNLRVMWERALWEDFPRHAKPREAAVLVTAAAVFEGDRGTVIVGGRVDSGVIDEESDVFGSFDPLNAELERERAVRTRAGGDASRRSGGGGYGVVEREIATPALQLLRVRDGHRGDSVDARERRFPPGRARSRGRARPAARPQARRRRARSERGEALRRSGVPRVPRERRAFRDAAPVDGARGHVVRFGEVSASQRSELVEGAESARRRGARLFSGTTATSKRSSTKTRFRTSSSRTRRRASRWCTFSGAGLCARCS
jgi:hypothetical protein